MMTNLTFTVDSALLGELGERLVEKVHYALVELVKNAYDADATEVILKFTESDSGKELHIIDNGTGMTFDEVHNYWMHIATTNKAVQQRSRKYGRPKTGSKGIGRFSCRRLGKVLQLTTIGKGEDQFEKTQIVFDWEKFKPGTEITTIECSGVQEKLSYSQIGTELVIKNLNEEWNQRGYNYLKRKLSVLVANRGYKRKGYEKDPGFNISIDAPGLEGKVRDLREDVINAGWGTVTAFINENHQAVCRLSALGADNKIHNKEIVSTQKFPHLNDISLKIGVMPIDRKQMRDTNTVSVTTLREITEEWGGVQISYHGFRVFPYGDDDWLGIDEDRGYRRGAVDREENEQLYNFASTLKGVKPPKALLSLLSMKSYLGTVEIGPNSEGFEVKASREGFLQTKQFDELRKFTRFAIDWSTIYRDFFIREKRKKEAEESREALEGEIGGNVEETLAVKSAIKYLQDEFKTISSSLPNSERKVVSRAVTRATDVILKHDELNKEKISHLRLIASTSTLLLIFSHEVKSLLGTLESIGSNFELFKKHLPPEQIKNADPLIKQLNNAKTRFKDLLGLTALIGVNAQKESPKTLALRDRVEQSVKAFDLITRAYQIEIDYDGVPNNILVGPLYEAELYSILLNLISNSIKSIIAAGKIKKVKIEAFKGGGLNNILISDTGIGLDPEADQDVFIPFVADQRGILYSSLESRLNPEDKYVVGTGSGLGLSIVKDILLSRNGKINILPPKHPWKAVIEVIIP